LYPIDFFLKHFYDRFFPKECAAAFSKYKRVNPTLGLRLAYLDKFAEPNSMSYEQSELDDGLNDVMEEIEQADWFERMLDDVRTSANGLRFEELSIDRSSASGYPYPQGTKRRDCFEHAMTEAERLYHNDTYFNEYSANHVWYTTGRAKILDKAKPDSGRLICYAGFAYMLFGMLLVQPWAYFMNKCEWCGVGWSWMHGGAERFARKFKARNGKAPEGYRYVSVDIKEWDTRLPHPLMMMLVVFYTWLMEKAGVNDGYAKKFLVVLKDMINARILFPLGYLFQVFQGMKSGWCNTANDNTLLHKIVFNAIMRRIGYMLHVLYGDDNFLLVPDHISDVDLINEYARFGLIIGTIHSSIWLCEVDYLSKYVYYDADTNQYFVYRDATESHSRILMPEELDPGFRGRPDALIGAERCLGHLLDNPFNANVRHICYSLLSKLKKHYQIEYVQVTDEMKRQHPWRQFDHLPSRIPTVPPVEWIEDLYGVSVRPLEFTWPALPTLFNLEPTVRESDCLMFDQSMSIVISTAARLNRLSRRRRKTLVKVSSPYLVPSSTYGTHAARFEFGMKYFDLHFYNVLDLGSHPGACAHSMLKVCGDVTCVTLPVDDGIVCPYVFRDESVTIIEEDANVYKPTRSFDLIHDDVDISRTKTVAVEASLAKEALRRAIRYSANTNCYLLTLRHINPAILVSLYEAYRCYGYIDMVKPVFSAPWKCEFMVCFKKRRTGYLMRRNNFFQMMNAFLNRQANSLIRWNEYLLASSRSENFFTHPLRNDLDFQKSMEKWLIINQPCGCKLTKC
jgi:hypothetical protein